MENGLPVEKVVTVVIGETIVTGRLEPIMLKNLPIIPSQTSQKFYPLFLIYSQIITYYSFNFTGSVKIMSKMHIKLFGNCAADVQRIKNLSKMSFCQ